MSGLGVDPGRFVARGRGGRVFSKLAIGTKIRYRLSEDATVTFRVQRSRAGRRVKGKCKPRTRRNRKKRKCDLQLGGSFKHAGRGGASEFRFSGRLRGRKLSPGSYYLVATAKDVSGKTSKRQRVKFRIAKQRK